MTSSRLSIRSRSWRLAAVLIASPTAAFAYVDPGSGMLIWQGLLAAVGAAIVFMRNPVETIKGIVNRLRGK